MCVLDIVKIWVQKYWAIIQARLNHKTFKNSKQYWQRRYLIGGNSGAGSYNQLAAFKAEVINAFVKKHNINSVIELGCGDGNQLELLQIPNYIGYDISDYVLDRCRSKFRGDQTKRFLHMDEIGGSKSDLTISLDVIFHLIEDDVYHNYMKQLFDLSLQYVIIYSSNKDDHDSCAPHVRHRKFISWVNTNAKQFELITKIPNRYPFDQSNPELTSFCDFYIFRKSD